MDSSNVADAYLSRVITHLRDCWMHPDVGIVSAAIMDPSHRLVFGVSTRTTSGSWIHAERNALINFKLAFGRPSPDSLVLTTLSPCTKVCSLSRSGPPCAQLLADNGLSKVHAGCIDVYAAPRGIEYYKEMDIELSVTEDPVCKTISEDLYNLFVRFGNCVNSDLERIKMEIGSALFSPLKSSALHLS